MNIFKNIIFLVCSTISFSIAAWDGERIEIRRGPNSVAFEIRYFNGNEPDAFTQMYNEGFRFCGNHVATQTDTQILSVCGPLQHFYAPNCNGIYECFKKLVYAENPVDFKDLFLIHNRWIMNGIKFPKINKKYTASRMIVLADGDNKAEYATIVKAYKVAMKKLAQENGVTYRETKFKNGRSVECNESWAFWTPKNNRWSKLKNFVWNEKFLYSLGALSALYLGYEYLKQT